MAYSITFLYVATAVGDEGGFAPNFQDNKEGTVVKKWLYRTTNGCQQEAKERSGEMRIEGV